MKFYFYIFFLIVLFSSCNHDENGSRVDFDYQNNLLTINTDSSSIVPISILYPTGDIYVDTIKCVTSINLKSAICRIGKQQELALYSSKYGEVVSCKTKIGVQDTTFALNLESNPSNIATVQANGKMAKLIEKNSGENYEEKARRWLFKHHENLPDSLIQKFIATSREIEKGDYYEYETEQIIPVVQNLQDCTYSIETELFADYYAIIACSSQNEIDKFVEDLVSKNYKYAVSDLSNPIQAYRMGDANGLKAIMLIALNKDWSYKLAPLGLLLIDNQEPLVHKNSSQPENEESYSDIIIPHSKLKINIPNNISPIQGVLNISEGSFQGYYSHNIPFYFRFCGDIESVTIIQEGNKSKFSDGDRKETFVLTDKRSPFTCKCTIYHLEIGDNFIPMIVKDVHGNEHSIKYPISLVSTKD